VSGKYFKPLATAEEQASVTYLEACDASCTALPCRASEKKERELGVYQVVVKTKDTCWRLQLGRDCQLLVNYTSHDRLLVPVYTLSNPTQLMPSPRYSPQINTEFVHLRPLIYGSVLCMYSKSPIVIKL